MKYIKNLKLIVLLLLFPQLSWGGNPVKVKAVPFSALVFYPEYSAPATVVSLNETVLSAEIKANISHIDAKVGDRLIKGSTVVRLECRDYRLMLNQAEAVLDGIEARFDFAKRRLQRAERLQSEQNISVEVLEQNQMEVAGLQAEVSAQQAAVAMARRNVDKCTVKVPFDAVVVERLASVGTLATPGKPLVKVVDTANVEITAKVMLSEIDSLATASRLEFHGNKRIYPVTLRKVVEVVEPLQRSRDVRLLFAAEPALAGQSGRLVWRGSNAVIPADFLVYRDGRSGIFVVEDGVAKFYEVADALEGRPIPIEMSEDRLVITEGRFALSDGERITVVQ